MDVVANEKDLKKKKDQLKEELRERKNELKEKQNILRKQEKQMKDQHESLIKLEEKCRKLQALITQKKAGGNAASPEPQAKTQADVEALQVEIKEEEKSYNEEKKKYKQLITSKEQKVKDLSLQLERLNLDLKQKDQECRINTLKINELKRQLKLGAQKQNAGASGNKGPKTIEKDPQIAFNVEQLKKDMQAEKKNRPTENEFDLQKHNDEEKQVNTPGSDSLRGESALVPKKPNPPADQNKNKQKELPAAPEVKEEPKK